MHLLLRCLVCFVLLFGIVAEASASDRKVIAITDFQNASAATNLPGIINTHITNEIVKNRSYKLLNQTILRDLSGLSAKLYDEADNPEIDKLAGINFLLVGVIKEADTRHLTINGFGRLRARVLVNIRLIHVPARQVLYAGSIIGEANQTYLLERQKHLTEADSIALLETAAKQAAAQIAAKVNSLNPMTGIVLQIDPTGITIDLGSEQGVTVGQEYRLYADGDPIIHPVTKLELGKQKLFCAVVLITQANKLTSTAKIIQGKIEDVTPGLNAIIK